MEEGGEGEKYAGCPLTHYTKKKKIVDPGEETDGGNFLARPGTGNSPRIFQNISRKKKKGE